jgi:hypothetical protein
MGLSAGALVPEMLANQSELQLNLVLGDKMWRSFH